MKPIVLEVVAKMITTFDQCSRCTIIFDEAGLRRQYQQEEFNQFPEDLKEEFVKLTDWLREFSRLYKHRLLIKLIDAHSLPGIYKAIRHRIRKYPAFIVDGQETVFGWDREELERLIDRHIKAFALSRQQGLRSSLS